MKRRLLAIVSILLAASAFVFAQYQYTESQSGAGKQFGSKPTDRLGFFGATPVPQQSLTNLAPGILTNTLSGNSRLSTNLIAVTYDVVTITNVLDAEVTTNIYVLTNTTVTVAVAPIVTNITGYATAYGFASSNQAAQIINALRNLGLAR